MGSYSYYEPPDQRTYFGLCGTGQEWQSNIQLTSNPSFELFAIPREKDADHWPELAEMADRLNTAFNKIFQEVVEHHYEAHRERAENLEVTIHLQEDGMRLVYADADPDREEMGLPPASNGEPATVA